jgi:hypothetical protein
VWLVAASLYATRTCARCPLPDVLTRADETPSTACKLLCCTTPAPLTSVCTTQPACAPSNPSSGGPAEAAVGVEVLAGNTTPEGVPVGVAVGVRVPVGVCVGVEVGVSVPVGVFVGVEVGVSVPMGVFVGVEVGVSVPVGVFVGVEVGVSVPVGVFDDVNVPVGVLVAVSTGVADKVLPGDGDCGGAIATVAPMLTTGNHARDGSPSG